MAETKWTPEQKRVIDHAEYIVDFHYPTAKRLTRPCARCGHGHTLHEHYRAGTDCASCGRAACWAYKQPGIIPATIRALRQFGAWWKRVTA